MTFPRICGRDISMPILTRSTQILAPTRPGYFVRKARIPIRLRVFARGLFGTGSIMDDTELSMPIQCGHSFADGSNFAINNFTLGTSANNMRQNEFTRSSGAPSYIGRSPGFDRALAGCWTPRAGTGETLHRFSGGGPDRWTVDRRDRVVRSGTSRK